MAIAKEKLMRRRVAWLGSLMDCGDEGCGLCRVCRRMAYLEWVDAVAPRDIPHSIERDSIVDAHIAKRYS